MHELRRESRAFAARGSCGLSLHFPVLYAQNHAYPSLLRAYKLLSLSIVLPDPPPKGSMSACEARSRPSNDIQRRARHDTKISEECTIGTPKIVEADR